MCVYMCMLPMSFYIWD